MFSRDPPFMRLTVGDLFHASGDPRKLVGLVIAVTDRSVYARNVMGDAYHEFDRHTGIEQAHGSDMVIDSIEPLPVEIHAVILGIERKYRLTMDRSRGRLTETEKSALALAFSHYEKHAISKTSPEA
jgi:hypothetical protein